MPTTINRLLHRLSSSRRSFSVSSEAKKKKKSSSPPPISESINNRMNMPHTASWCCSPKCSSSLTSGSQCGAENHPKLSAHSSPLLSQILGSSNMSLSGKTKEVAPNPPVLPETLFLKCLDYIEDPFELCRLRRVSSGVRQYVRTRMEHVTHMDVSKVKFSDSTCAQISLCSTSIVLERNQQWYAHPSGNYKVLMRLVPLTPQQLQAKGQEEYRVELKVDNCWTSRDVSLLCSVLLNVFRHNLKIIHVDAPIVELIIASLSIIDLDRWYAFQCFMKAVNDHQMHIHLAINHLPANPSNNPHDLYWPKVETLVIRSTERQSAHLARLLDYGVRSQLVMDRRKLDMLKIELTGVKAMNKDLKRNLYHFRCWAGSAGFDDRFSQHYSVNVV